MRTTTSCSPSSGGRCGIATAGRARAPAQGGRRARGVRRPSSPPTPVCRRSGRDGRPDGIRRCHPRLATDEPGVRRLRPPTTLDDVALAAAWETLSRLHEAAHRASAHRSEHVLVCRRLGVLLDGSRLGQRAPSPDELATDLSRACRRHARPSTGHRAGDPRQPDGDRPRRPRQRCFRTCSPPPSPAGLRVALKPAAHRRRRAAQRGRRARRGGPARACPPTPHHRRTLVQLGLLVLVAAARPSSSSATSTSTSCRTICKTRRGTGSWPRPSLPSSTRLLQAALDPRHRPGPAGIRAGLRHAARDRLHERRAALGVRADGRQRPLLPAPGRLPAGAITAGAIHSFAGNSSRSSCSLLLLVFSSPYSMLSTSARQTTRR